MEGIRRALVLGLVLIAGTAIKQVPSVGPQTHTYSMALFGFSGSSYNPTNTETYKTHSFIYLHSRIMNIIPDHKNT